MKAYVLHGVNDIRLEDMNMPKPGEHEVIVKVMAVGICGSDIPRIYTTGAHRHPLIPGHEFAGKVVELGAGIKGDWLNKKVGVFPLIPCGKCGPCSNNQFEMCRDYNYLGSRCDGGFAEYVAVPENNLISLPDQVEYTSAAMLEPMAVAVHAMRRNLPDKNDSIAICGLGTIGLMLLMFLLEAGYSNIYVIGNKDTQKKIALDLGLKAEHYCNSKSEDVRCWINEHTASKGIDAFYECVGRNETVSLAIDMTAPAGAVTLVGNPYSDMTLNKDIYWKILRNQLRVTGTWNSSFTHNINDDWDYVVKRLSSGSINPQILITHLLKLEELEKGLHIMRDKSEEYVKIMLKMV